MRINRKKLFWISLIVGILCGFCADCHMVMQETKPSEYKGDSLEAFPRIHVKIVGKFQPIRFKEHLALQTVTGRDVGTVMVEMANGKRLSVTIEREEAEKKETDISLVPTASSFMPVLERIANVPPP